MHNQGDNSDNQRQQADEFLEVDKDDGRLGKGIRDYDLLIAYFDDKSLPGAKISDDIVTGPELPILNQRDSMPSSKSLPITKADIISHIDKTCIEQKQPHDVQARLADNIKRIDARSDISSQEKQLVYKDLMRLTAPSERAFFKDKERLHIADQLAFMVGQPNRNEQGTAPSCSTTELRTINLLEEPHIATKLITDVALTGKFKTVDGTVIQPTRRSLTAGVEEMNFRPNEAWATWPGLIYDTIAANIHWNRATQDNVGRVADKGSMSYEKTEHGDRIVHNLNGQRYYVTDQNARPLTGPALIPTAIADVYRQIGGKEPDGRIVVYSPYASTDKGVTHVADYNSFMKAMREGPPHKIVQVHTSREPFFQEIHSVNGGTPTWHAVLARRAGAADTHIAVDSPGLQGHDHIAPGTQLHSATLYNATLGAVQAAPVNYVRSIQSIYPQQYRGRRR